MPSDLVLDNFLDDKIFAEQRLAGVHPLQLSRLFKSGKSIISKYHILKKYHSDISCINDEQYDS